ncbi:MAG: hypothetical protein PHG20_07360 [Geobacteraceae bacterium]|nr:hypothetical protein [Geobacteraceae bacterium]
MNSHFKLVCAVCIFFVMAIVTAGCSSKELTRSEARKILEKTTGKEIGDLNSGFVVAGGIPSSDAFMGLEKHITPEDYRTLEREGMIKLENMGLVVFGERFLVTFPEDINKKYVLSTETKDTVEMDGKKFTKDVSKVVLGQSSIKEITGIRQEGKETGAKARVEFTVHMEVTPFGKVMLLPSLQGDVPYIAKFEKYDDGWRIVKNGLYPVAMARKMGME